MEDAEHDALRYLDFDPRLWGLVRSNNVSLCPVSGYAQSRRTTCGKARGGDGDSGHNAPAARSGGDRAIQLAGVLRRGASGLAGRRRRGDAR